MAGERNGKAFGSPEGISRGFSLFARSCELRSALKRGYFVRRRQTLPGQVSSVPRSVARSALTRLIALLICPGSGRRCAERLIAVVQRHAFDAGLNIYGEVVPLPA